MVRQRKPPSQTWQTFPENHIKTMVSVDFLTVPTIRFQVVCVFLILAHERRIVHFGCHGPPHGRVARPATPRRISVEFAAEFGVAIVQKIPTAV